MNKLGFLDRVLGKIGKLDAEELQSLIQRLVKEKGFFETLFNTIRDGIIVFDEKGKIIYFNNAASSLVGLEPSKDLGNTIQNALPFLDWETINPLDKEHSKSVVRLELEVDFPTLRYLRIYATSLDIGVDGGKRAVLILHDITELQKKTAKEVESECLRLLTLLAGMLAHEIGNPLNALSIHTQLIHREIKKIKKLIPPVKGESDAKSVEANTPIDIKSIETSLNKLDEYIKTVDHEIDRLDLIIKQYLQAIRPSPPVLSLNNLNAVVKETVDLLYPEIEKRQLVVKENYAPNLSLVAFDPTQIKQALINLIKNAIQAMTKGGVLTVETGQTHDDVWVAISDTGGGIPVEKMNRLFEPFYTTKQKGSGIGLMIVQRIVRDHRGKIEIENRTGEGATFRIRLPLQKKLPPSSIYTAIIIIGLFSGCIALL